MRTLTKTTAIQSATIARSFMNGKPRIAAAIKNDGATWTGKGPRRKRSTERAVCGVCTPAPLLDRRRKPHIDTRKEASLERGGTEAEAQARRATVPIPARARLPGARLDPPARLPGRLPGGLGERPLAAEEHRQEPRRI